MGRNPIRQRPTAPVRMLSLRWHYPNQVTRVEGGTLLSACHTSSPDDLLVYTYIIYALPDKYKPCRGILGGGGPFWDQRRLAPATWFPCPVPGGIQAFSRESPDAKKSRGVTPRPPFKARSLALARFGVVGRAGGGRGLCPGGPSPDGGRQLEPGNPEQSEEQGTVAQYSEALGGRRTWASPAKRSSRYARTSLQTGGQEMGEENPPGAARRKCRCDWGRLAILRRSRPGPFQATPATRIRLITRTVPLCRSGPAPVKATPATQRCPLRTGYRKTKKNCQQQCALKSGRASRRNFCARDSI